MVQKRVDERSAFYAAARVNGKPLLFVYNGKTIVFVNNIEGNIFRFEAYFLGIGNFERYLVARF